MKKATIILLFSIPEQPLDLIRVIHCENKSGSNLKGGLEESRK